MLRMTNLSKVYRTHMIETHALRGFEIAVREGEFVTVTGPSGSGKTSFLNIAGLLEEFSSGEYILDGAPKRKREDPEYQAKFTRTALRMPAYRGFVSDAQVEDLVAYLQLVNNPSNDAAPDASARDDESTDADQFRQHACGCAVAHPAEASAWYSRI